MARTTTSFGKRLREAREAAGCRLDEASVFARQLLGPSYGVSRETIRRMEVGYMDEEEADPLFVAALAAVYKVPVAKLSPVIAVEVEKLTAFLSRLEKAAG